jgi:general secretion pathway protein G
MRIPERYLSPEARAKRRDAQRAARRSAEAGARHTTWAGSWMADGRPVIAVAAVALLAGAALLLTQRSRVPEEAGTEAPAHETRIVNDLRALRIALERFRVDCGRYPRTDERLESVARDRNFIGWRGPYVNLVRSDPWFRPYVYRSDGQELTLLCLGEDGQEGTADDILPPPFTADEVAGKGRDWVDPEATNAPPSAPAPPPADAPAVPDGASLPVPDAA